MDFLYNSAKSSSKLGTDEENVKTPSDREEYPVSPSSFKLTKCNDDQVISLDKRVKPFSLTSMNDNANEIKFNFAENYSERTDSLILGPNKLNINKQNSIFQDELILSLDHLKTNFKSSNKK